MPPRSPLISTHAPLAGRDFYQPPFLRWELLDFNPRAPCGARPAIRGRSRPTSGHFNPRAPCGARRHQPRQRDRKPISTHAPLAGRDLAALLQSLEQCDFNPRAPCGARRRGRRRDPLHQDISTHAPLAGRDARFSTSLLAWTNFNPRAPCGARLLTLSVEIDEWQDFNPRAPCGARRCRCAAENL